ncbi:MAG: hypothetical protein JNK07_04245 [Alphaproteobacteria bacterium]|nr:hypothetical protein [Alphaproteobacteria bacterium]
MYDKLVQWIGSKTCSVAGDLGQVLDAGQACASNHAWTMGLIVLGLVAFGLAVMVINARRRRRRDNYYI